MITQDYFEELLVMDSCIYFNIKASTVLEVTREDSSAI